MHTESNGDDRVLENLLSSKKDLLASKKPTSDPVMINYYVQHMPSYFN